MNQIIFKGDYASWAEAQRDSAGYDQEAVLKQTLAATLAVKEGRAASCRDGVILDKVEYNWPLIATLQRVTREKKWLKVIDFGGGLGSAYFDCREYLHGMQVNWIIIEQEEIALAGIEHIEKKANHKLRFYSSLKNASWWKPNVVLASGSLQYVPSPYETLSELHELYADYMFLDRMPFIDAERDILSVQYVPRSIVESSYPAWFFSYDKFRDWIRESSYTLIDELEGKDTGYQFERQSWFKGFILKRN